METIQVQWRRTRSDKGLELWIKEVGPYNWVRYRHSKYYIPDSFVSSNSGMATFQNYLNLSKKNLFKLDILQVKPEDMKDE